MWRRLGLSPVSAQNLRRILNLYPPYLGAGVQVVEVADDFSRCVVQMPLHRWNSNYFGTHFGGSLYSMCDPFYVLMLARTLGPNYMVWDKAATIRFKKPGRGVVSATFVLPADKVEAIRQQVAENRRTEPTFMVEVRDAQGELVAEIDKLLYVRKKREP